ncbi:MAG: peptidylprolyl isomerase [Tepidisphaeraceae bacterium]|jgi:peptidyl-prolyl cis-trans isomerase C
MSLISSRNLILATALCAGFGFSACAADAAAPAPATQPATKPAAATVVTVNGKALSSSDFDQEMRGLQSRYARQIPPEQMAQMLPQMRQRAMQNLVSKQLLLQAAVDRKIAVSDEELKKSIDDLLKNNPSGETLEAMLGRVGISVKDFNQQMADSMRIEKLLDQETKSATASDEEVTKFYTEHPEQFKREETVSARHILVSFAPGDDDAKKAEKKKKAEGLREQLVKGGDFAKICAANSDDPGSKENGGLYEDFPRGQMVPPFDKAAFSQKTGEIGPIVETSFGYHIIKVEKHNDAGAVPMAEIKERLQTFLKQQKGQEIVQKYVSGLRDSAKITYADGYAPPTTQPTAK